MTRILQAKTGPKSHYYKTLSTKLVPNSSSIYRWLVKWVLLALIILASGCATYQQDFNGVLTSVEKADFAVSETTLGAVLSPEGDDRLLYYLELGVIKHLEKDFKASNSALSQAERIAEDLETVSVKDKALQYLSNPRNGPYRGSEHEKVLINYYKSLNYLGLAERSTNSNDRYSQLESARIEARRMLIKLNDLNSRKGDYEEYNDKKSQTFSKIMALLNKLQDSIDFEAITYRDDAFSHYLIGLSFEMNGEYDDARISYEKAAKAYEDGYAQQFNLGQDMTQQAWFDTYRMKKLTDTFDNIDKKDARQRLNSEQFRELDNTLKNFQNKGELIVIEHKGLAPRKGEINVLVTTNAENKEVLFQPLATDRDQRAWFYALYSDKSGYKALMGLLQNRLTSEFFNPYTKTLPLGPVWDVAESLNLSQTLSGIRVTAPYYPPVKNNGDSVLQILNQKYKLENASNPAQMAVQNLMVNAGNELNSAIARAVVKGALLNTALGKAEKAAGGGGMLGSLMSAASKAVTSASEAAETRSWLLLPQDILIRRVSLEPGEYPVKLTSQLQRGQIINNQAVVSIQPGKIELLQVRTLPGQAGQTLVMAND